MIVSMVVSMLCSGIRRRHGHATSCATATDARERFGGNSAARKARKKIWRELPIDKPLLKDLAGNFATQNTSYTHRKALARPGERSWTMTIRIRHKKAARRHHSTSNNTCLPKFSSIAADHLKLKLKLKLTLTLKSSHRQEEKKQHESQWSHRHRHRLRRSRRRGQTWIY